MSHSSPSRGSSPSISYASTSTRSSSSRIAPEWHDEDVRRDDRRRRASTAPWRGEELRLCHPGLHGPRTTKTCSPSSVSARASSRRRHAGGSAATAFAATAAYEAAIARWFQPNDETSPDTSFPRSTRSSSSRTGRIPHQRAAYYAERGVRSHLLSRVEQVPREAAVVQQPQRSLRRAPAPSEFGCPACAIVKHANPCGVAIAATIEEAYAQSTSRRSGLRIRRRRRAQPRGLGDARYLAHRAIRRGALRAGLRRAGDRGARRKASVTVSTTPSGDASRRPSGTTAAFSGGCSCRTATGTSPNETGWRSSAAGLPEEQWGDLLFAWRVVKHVASNAIVLARRLQTIGIGAGQMSRVDAVRIALEKALELGHDLDRSGACLRRLLPVPGWPATRARGRD